MAGKLIVRGIEQILLGATLDVLIDGNNVARVKVNDCVTIPIKKSCTMSIRCGLNFSRPSIHIPDGMISEVQCIYSQFTGSFKLKLLSQTPYNVSEDSILNSEQPVYDIHGARGRSLKVYEDKCIISTEVTLGSLLTQNYDDGEKTIYYIDCIGVQFKKSHLQLGYLQLETASSTMNNRASNFFNENSFTFDPSTVSNEKMEEVANFVRKQIEQAKKARNTPSAVVAALSPADELKKFKDLLDSNIITQEEFEAKKRKLLDL